MPEIDNNGQLVGMLCIIDHYMTITSIISALNREERNALIKRIEYFNSILSD